MAVDTLGYLLAAVSTHANELNRAQVPSRATDGQRAHWAPVHGGPNVPLGAALMTAYKRS